RGMKEGDYENELAPSINPFKNKGVAAALFVIVLCILYTMLFNKLGYVLVSACISVITMWLIGKRDLKIIIPVSIIVPLVMWFIFYKMLTVNIPMGVLQPIRDLVDKI
ncbi:MAG: tripartite tricarboxylate transporter TctB family protein, partial [Synergistaceae bacterium]|nr:tripartite tricarboxylate transporter TctB family protein [Synergistaceae bacterium]